MYNNTKGNTTYNIKMPQSMVACPPRNSGGDIWQAFALIILLSTIACIYPHQGFFILTYLSLIALSIFNRSIFFDFSTLAAGIIFVLLNWFYLSLGSIQWGWEDATLLVATRVLLLFFCFLISFRYFKIHKKIDVTLLSSFLLTLFSFSRSSDFYTALKYLANVYIPYLSLFYIIFSISPTGNINKQKSKIVKGIAKNFLFTILIFDLLFISIEELGIFDSATFFSMAGNILRADGGWEGNFRTMLFGIEQQREPGLFGDPIVASYFLTSALMCIAILQKGFIKWAYIFLSLFLLALAKSKSSLILIALGALGLLIYKLKAPKSIKIFISVILYISALALTLVKASSSSSIDSSYIHYQGLIAPFLRPLDFNYLLGNDLGSGGNMGGGSDQGAESFVGLLMYNLGIAGVLLYLALFLRVIILAYSNNTPAKSIFLVSIIIPVMLASFLQENPYNLSYAAPRIALLLIILISTRRSSPS